MAAPMPLPAPAHVHPIYARLLRLLLQQQGLVDGDRLMADAGVDPRALMTDDARLGTPTIVRLVAAALAATGRPWLGLELGALAPVSSHGSVGYAVVTAPDARTALAVLARYATLRSDALAFELAPLPHDGVQLRLPERHALGAARGFVLDATLAVVLRVLEAAAGPLPATLQVALPFTAPAWCREYARLGPLDVRFGQPVMALSLDAAWLARPCLGADARAHATACRACDDALAERDGGALSPRVAALLEGLGPDGPLPMTAVASRCGVSPRTLMRRLKAEGTSYQRLLDARRQERALWLLQHTSRAVEDIAAELGFVDTSNFSRTVRRWFGTTPRRIRATVDG